MDTALRQLGIGGSEVAAILGLDEYRDAFSVWAEKRGEYEPSPPSPRMKLGKFIERGIIEFYSELTGRETTFLDITYRSSVYPWMIWTPDAICTKERRGVDAKLVSWDQRHKWGPTPDDIPARAQLQAHYYIAAMDYERWDIAVLLGMEEPVIHTIERDLEIEEPMLDAVDEFYRRYLIGDERPPIGATAESVEYLRQKFPRHKAKLRRAHEREVELLHGYAQVRADERLVKKEKTRIENELKLAVGDAEGLEWERGRFTWKNTKDGSFTDWEAIAQRFMASWGEENRKQLINEYTEPVPGVRRIHFTCDEGNE